jgi:tRNA-uridine 2-sulfurtransferase
MQKPQTIYVAMSGGVDSSVAALLLHRHGFNVIGVFMKPWQPSGVRCLWQTDREDALRVAAHLNIPLKTWDFSDAYGSRVARPMIAGYRRGITPNPDVECNRHIKFGLFAERAFREGADAIATGHYAAIIEDNIQRPRDLEKDQTYFLWGIDPALLSRIQFPLAELTKRQVRSIARRAGLITAAKKDSQGVCFVGELDMKSFLAQRIKQRPGRIMHCDGRELGTHDGAAYYTIGQRHGLDIKDGGGPYFVISRDVRRNTVTVGPASALAATSARMIKMHWLAPKPTAHELVLIQIRYRTQPVPALVGRTGTIQFQEPVRAVAPGQSAVVYRGDTLIGGGILAEN